MWTIIQQIIVAVISSAAFGAIIVFFAKKYIVSSFEAKYKRIQAERETMEIFLKMWYERRTDDSQEWRNTFMKSVRDMIIWCPNNVLYHIGMYIANIGKNEAEIHFGKAIIYYRRTLGYKNRWWIWWKKVTPEHIISIYCTGDKDKVK